MVAASNKKKPPPTTTTTTRRPAEKPHFFKILLRDFARRLKLPPRFVGEHLRGPSDAAVVHDVDGGAWNVVLERTSNDAFLSGGGWAKFVEDHRLQEHEFVVFRYDGDMHFTVVMAFDTSACEKDMISGESYRFKEVKEEEDVTCTSPGTGLKNFAAHLRNKSKDVKHSGGYISRRHRARKEIMKDGDPFPFLSTFPYFISRMNRGTIVSSHILWLPMEFSRTHLPSIKTCTDLRNSDGDVWTVVYIPSQKGRGFFSGGWTAFVRGNNLQIGDYCAFEMVAPAEFNVTVIRADEVINNE